MSTNGSAANRLTPAPSAPNRSSTSRRVRRPARARAAAATRPSMRLSNSLRTDVGQEERPAGAAERGVVAVRRAGDLLGDAAARAGAEALVDVGRGDRGGDV